MPTIQRYLAKLVEVHGARHSELACVAACFGTMSRELGQHLLKEERVLFPYIRELAATSVEGRHGPSPFGTVQNLIRMMEREHREAADELRIIREFDTWLRRTGRGVQQAAPRLIDTAHDCGDTLQRLFDDSHRPKPNQHR